MFKKQKIFFAGLMTVLLLSFMGCPAQPEPITNIVENPNEVTINGATLDSNEWKYYSVPIQPDNCEVTLDFSVEMYVENKSGKDQKLMWQVDIKNSYPVIAEHTFGPGTTGWTTVTGKGKEVIGAGQLFYLSTYETDKANLVIKIRNLKLSVTGAPVSNEKEILWTDPEVPALKDVLNYDYVGLACENNEISNTNIQEAFKKHINTTTMGNEFKPDFIFNWGWNEYRNNLTNFTASNGQTIKVPANLSGFANRIDPCLRACKKAGIQMRGHVLVWHSQTPDEFFAENYSPAYDNSSSKTTITNMVSKEVMDARQEWYIKTVLEHVANWEKENNDGKHIVWAWDVVNEAMADDADVNSNWVRGSTNGTKNKAPSNGGSRWYQLYGSQEFIINAFRYANKYAPADVKLCYNDYNEYMNGKIDAIVKILKELQSHENDTNLPTRINAMGMQSHVGTTWPGSTGYESAIRRYLNLGLDVHITEFDISAKSIKESKDAYKDYFSVIKKYGNNNNSYNGHKITCVTFWGINDENSWISNSNGSKQYPLLFTKKGSNYYTKDAFWAVVDAVK